MKVGQEFAMEQKDSTDTMLEFSLPPEFAFQTMELELWLTTYGFILFSNATCMFDDESLLTDIPGLRLYHDLIEKIRLKNKLSN